MDINIEETNKTLNLLKSLNLEEATYEDVKGLIVKLYKHIGVKYRLKKHRFIQRGVLLDNEEIDFFPKLVQRISFNPNGSRFGRANYFNKPAFYGCISTEIMQGYNCTAMEILPMKKDGLYKHRFVIGNWLLADDCEFVILGGSESLNYLCQAGVDRAHTFHNNIKNYKEVIISLYAIDKFLCNEFSKLVDEGSPWNYKISAAYSELLKENGEMGLIYPSVKTEGAGLNIVLFPEYVNKGLITFDRALYGTFYNRNGEYCNEYTLSCISNNGVNLQWHDEYKRLRTNVKNYYTGKTDENPLKTVPLLDLGKPIN